jgi:hypothetical protein
LVDFYYSMKDVFEIIFLMSVLCEWLNEFNFSTEILATSFFFISPFFCGVGSKKLTEELGTIPFFGKPELCL